MSNGLGLKTVTPFLYERFLIPGRQPTTLATFFIKLRTVKKISSTKKYTSKQMGDSCEMLVAAEMTLAGIPTLKVPDNWPGYDLIAQRPDGSPPLRISVKSRTFKRRGAGVEYWITDSFDWLAIVLLPGGTEESRRFFIIPRDVADREARRNSPTSKMADMRYWFHAEVLEKFAAFENNFSLLRPEDTIGAE